MDKQIVLTQAMIDAATAKLACFNSDYATLEEGAEEIVRAALEASEAK